MDFIEYSKYIKTKLINLDPLHIFSIFQILNNVLKLFSLNMLLSIVLTVRRNYLKEILKNNIFLKIRQNKNA